MFLSRMWGSSAPQDPTGVTMREDAELLSASPGRAVSPHWARLHPECWLGEHVAAASCRRHPAVSTREPRPGDAGHSDETCRHAKWKKPGTNGRAAVTRRRPMGGLNSRPVLSHSPRGQKAGIKATTGLVRGDGSALCPSPHFRRRAGRPVSPGWQSSASASTWRSNAGLCPRFPWS